MWRMDKRITHWKSKHKMQMLNLVLYACVIPFQLEAASYLQVDNFPPTFFTGSALVNYSFFLFFPLQCLVWKHCTCQDSARTAL